MRVIIENRVHDAIQSFYEISLLKHIALDEETVRKKKARLYDALEALGKYAYIYPKSSYLQEWVKKDYREFLCEDFHFAYTIEVLYDGEVVAAVHDARHSFLMHNPED